jgi:hypothetical protein
MGDDLNYDLDDIIILVENKAIDMVMEAYEKYEKYMKMYADVLFESACEFGAIDIVKWMLLVNIRPPNYVYSCELAAMNKHLEIISILLTMNVIDRHDLVKISFEKIRSNSVVLWLIRKSEVHDHTPSLIDIFKRMLLSSYKNKNIESLKKILELINKNTTYYDIDDLFSSACCHNSIEVIDWLYESFSKSVDLHYSDDLPFRNSIKHGNHLVSQWLVETVKQHGSVIDLGILSINNIVFEECFNKTSNLITAQWLYNTYWQPDVTLVNFNNSIYKSIFIKYYNDYIFVNKYADSSDVYNIIHKHTGNLYVMKILHKEHHCFIKFEFTLGDDCPLHKTLTMTKLLSDIGIGVNLFDYHMFTNCLVLIMDYLPFTYNNLESKKKELIKPKIRAVLDILEQQGIVHGDLHHNNIMITYDDEAKLIDCESTFYISEYPEKVYLQKWITEAYKFPDLESFIEFEKIYCIDGLEYKAYLSSKNFKRKYFGDILVE